jgi:hypothetical protein
MGVIRNFKSFLNEIQYNKDGAETEFQLRIQKSKYFRGNDYIFDFTTDSGEEYIFEFIYMIDKIGPFTNRNLYNISFTTKKQKEEADAIQNDITKANIYESPTNKQETHELINKLIYIFNHFNEYYGEKLSCVYVIGETNDKRKILYYRNLIKMSFPNIEEIKGESSFNLNEDVYYFIIK